MSELKEIEIKPGEILRLIRRNLWATLLIIATCAFLALIVAMEVPAKYKAHAVLNIQSSYFRNPLVSDLISEVYDPAEQTAQTLAVFRLALSDGFLDDLDARYRIYATTNSHLGRIIEREKLLKKIEYFGLNKTSFQLSVTQGDSLKAFNLTHDVLARIIKTFIQQRREKLTGTRDAIEGAVDMLGVALEEAVSDPRTVFEKELVQAEAKLQTLGNEFTTAHPTYRSQQNRVRVLHSALATLNRRIAKRRSESKDSGPESLTQSSREPTQGIYNDLLRKLNNLNIVIEMESNPEGVSYIGVIEEPAIPVKAFFPDKKRFLLAGLALGLLLAGIRIIVDEIERGTFISAYHASDSLGVPYLGELPALETDSKILLLDGPGGRTQLKQLPSV